MKTLSTTFTALSSARSPWVAPLFTIAALPLAALGCGEPEDKGSVMLAVSTDMSVDKDVNRVDIVVQPQNGATQAIQVNLFPELEGKFLPGTFTIAEGSTPGEFVRVRVIARQGNEVRVVREAALQIPRGRTAVLPMPIQWLCDGEVRQEGQLYRSDCPEAQTCVAGSCVSDAVDQATLPDYVPEAVFGGGDATGGGECFDTLDCFTGAEEAEVDLETCRLATEPTDDLNVALWLPGGSDGHCTSSDCWIPLDASPATGWTATEDGDAVQLPNGVCDSIRERGANVRISHACFAKSAATPTCGPWTLVGTEPGSEPPLEGVPLVVTNQTLAVQLQAAAVRVGREVAAACGQIIGQTIGGQPSAESIDAACGAARAALGPLDWYHVTTRCWPDHEAQLECERACSDTCEPGTLDDRCNAAAVTGSCDAACASRECLGSAALPTTCAGACGGECTGTCDGDCFGECQGACGVPTLDGACAGACLGTCLGLCQGRCEGRCAGTCDGDPNLAIAPCDEGVACRGGCASEYESAVCQSPLSETPCALDAECAADCRAAGRINLSCEQAGAWVQPSLTLDEEAATRIGDALAVLLPVNDVAAATLLDEANTLAQELSDTAMGQGGDRLAAASALVRVQEAVDVLRAAADGADAVIEAVGDPRATPGPAGPGVDCTPAESPNIRPMIDDFEDGNTQILVQDGRDGYWHVIRDNSGGQLSMQEPPVPESGGANDSSKAMRLQGRDFTEWGAGFSVDLRQGAPPYDASLQRGLSFWSRGDTTLRVIFVQQNLSTGYACSNCSAEDCSQYYFADIPLTDTWTAYSLPWNGLAQSPVGVTPFDPNGLLTIKFESTTPNFEFWLDDVSFY
jgi:hypothetical protein